MKGLGTRQHPEQNMLREEVWFGGSHRLLELLSFFLMGFCADFVWFDDA